MSGKKPLHATVGPVTRPDRFRREREIARIVKLWGDPLEQLARTMRESDSESLRLAAAKALAPYVYPTLRSNELTSSDDALTVVVQRAVNVTPGAAAGAPQLGVTSLEVSELAVKNTQSEETDSDQDSESVH